MSLIISRILSPHCILQLFVSKQTDFFPSEKGEFWQNTTRYDLKLSAVSFIVETINIFYLQPSNVALNKVQTCQYCVSRYVIYPPSYLLFHHFLQNFSCFFSQRCLVTLFYYLNDQRTSGNSAFIKLLICHLQDVALGSVSICILCMLVIAIRPALCCIN